MALICDISEGHKCEGYVLRRACGHVACDAFTDDKTELCLYCVPISNDEYADAVLRVSGGSFVD